MGAPLVLVNADLTDIGIPNAVQIPHRGVDETDRFMLVPDVVVPAPHSDSAERRMAAPLSDGTTSDVLRPEVVDRGDLGQAS